MGTASTSSSNDYGRIGSARSTDSKQIFTDEWQTDGVSRSFVRSYDISKSFQNRTPTNDDDIHDLDSLLDQYDQPKKSNAKEQPSQKPSKPSAERFFDDSPPPPPVQQQQQPPKLPKYGIDTRKTNAPLFSSNEQHRTSAHKPVPKPSVKDSFDIDSILQGRSIQPQQPAKHSYTTVPAKNSASSVRKDSDLSDLFSNDYSSTKSHQPKVTTTTNMKSKPALDLNPDDYFSSRDQNENKAPFSTTKTSAKQYYLGNSRYKPGKNIPWRFTRKMN